MKRRAKHLFGKQKIVLWFVVKGCKTKQNLFFAQKMLSLSGLAAQQLQEASTRLLWSLSTSFQYRLLYTNSMHTFQGGGAKSLSKKLPLFRKVKSYCILDLTLSQAECLCINFNTIAIVLKYHRLLRVTKNIKLRVRDHMYNPPPLTFSDRAVEIGSAPPQPSMDMFQNTVLFVKPSLSLFL